MEPRRVCVSAPARLHFGLLCPGQGAVRRFGGVGVMLQQPRTTVRISPGPHYALPAESALARRLDQVVRHTCQYLSVEYPPPIQIELLERIAAHRGLGSGTQLAMGTAWALLGSFSPKPVPPQPQLLAQLAQRGRRSAVGVYGFCHGGWIVEPGKQEQESLAPLLLRLENPRPWRWLLVEPPLPSGCSGVREQQAFDALKNLPPETTDRLWRVLFGQLVPALQAGRFADTAQALGLYSRLAGECFAPFQGGTFAHPGIATLVEKIRRWGYEGVGQSSWGPTVFVLVENSQQALNLQQKLQAHSQLPLKFTITATETQGARVIEESGCSSTPSLTS